MNENQLRISKLLKELVCNNKDRYKIIPTTEEQLNVFIENTKRYNIPQDVVNQLIEFYEVANGFEYEICIGVHSCDDWIIFEFWNEKELWLGQRDMDTFRWSKGKFCLGSASCVSYSENHEFNTIPDFLEGTIREIKEFEKHSKEVIDTKELPKK
jgi:hypothetical protein